MDILIGALLSLFIILAIRLLDKHNIGNTQLIRKDISELKRTQAYSRNDEKQTKQTLAKVLKKVSKK